ncbi:MAG: thioredoxin family protein [Patescibacteria group bacterium]|nr:thioredoxin family protein [Patescibacteria group bacterium]
MSANEVILFVSRESATYFFTVRKVEEACGKAHDEDCKHELKVVHIEDDPEAAERYNIEALPTLIIGKRRFVGAPTADSIDTLVALMLADARSQNKESSSAEATEDKEEKRLM